MTQTRLDESAVADIIDLGGMELLRDLVGDFAGLTDSVVPAIMQAAAAGELQGARDGAHTLKSSSGSLGATDLCATASRVEALAAAGDAEGVRAATAGLPDQAAGAVTALRNRLE